MPEKHPVTAINKDGRPLEGEIEAWEDDFFSGLVIIRRELDAIGIKLKVYGSSLNVYPSPMSRSMGAGEKAYRLRMGEQAKSADLVSIFQSGPDVNPGTVPEQEISIGTGFRV